MAIDYYLLNQKITIEYFSAQRGRRLRTKKFIPLELAGFMQFLLDCNAESCILVGFLVPRRQVFSDVFLVTNADK